MVKYWTNIWTKSKSAHQDRPRQRGIGLAGMGVAAWAVAKSDLFMKDPAGRDADNIAYGSTLSSDRHAGTAFDYMIANPPYGKDWKRDEDSVRNEAGRTVGRFGAGLPRISDGQLLFLLHMLAHAKDPKDGGSRIAPVTHNVGTPLVCADIWC